MDEDVIVIAVVLVNWVVVVDSGRVWLWYNRIVVEPLRLYE